MVEYTFLDRLYDIFVYPIVRFFSRIKDKREDKKKEIIQSAIRREVTDQLIGIYDAAISDYLWHKLGWDYMNDNFFNNDNNVLHIEGDADTCITLYLNDSRFKSMPEKDWIYFSDDAELLHWHSEYLGYQLLHIEEDIKYMKKIIDELY